MTGVHAAPRFTRLIRGGTVVTTGGSFRADVALDGERIAAVEPGIPADAAADVVDATGLLVLPGIVDVHTHTRIPSDDEPDRFFQDTVAAAFGGTTTLLAFDNPGTGISVAAQRRLRDGVLEWRDRTRGDAAIDVGVSAVLTAQQEDPVGDLAWLVDQGVASVKCFLVYDFGIGEAQLAAVLREGARTGALIQVHGEDRAMLDAGIAAQLAGGETGARGHQRSRPPAVEAALKAGTFVSSLVFAMGQFFTGSRMASRFCESQYSMKSSRSCATGARAGTLIIICTANMAAPVWEAL